MVVVGIGVCLNKLQMNSKAELLREVPIHVILRSILDSSSLDEVHHKVQSQSTGKASATLVGNSQGQFLHFEFATDRLFHAKAKGEHNEIAYRTNHCIMYISNQTVFFYPYIYY